LGNKSSGFTLNNTNGGNNFGFGFAIPTLNTAHNGQDAKEPPKDENLALVTDLEIRLRNLIVQFGRAKAESAKSINKDLILNEIYRLICNFENCEIDPDILISSKLGKYLKSLHVLLYNYKNKIPEHLSQLLPMLTNQINRMKERIIRKFIEVDQQLICDDEELSKIICPELTKFDHREKAKDQKLSYIMDNFSMPVKFEDNGDSLGVIDLISDDDLSNSNNISTNLFQTLQAKPDEQTLQEPTLEAPKKQSGEKIISQEHTAESIKNIPSRTNLDLPNPNIIDDSSFTHEHSNGDPAENSNQVTSQGPQKSPEKNHYGVLKNSNENVLVSFFCR
jgi:hypothetical protein